MIRIYEANALFGGKETELYKCWKYLLDHPDLKPKDLFDVFPKLSYIHLKQGIDEGALVKNGRTYSANPDFQFKGVSRIQKQSVQEPVSEPVKQEPVRRSEPSVQKIGNITRFTISDDDYEFEDDVEDIKRRLIKGDKLTLGGYTWTCIGELQGHDLYLCDDVVRRMAFNDIGSDNSWSNSDIRRWLNNDFYNKLSDDEKEIIVKNMELNDNIFLLSKEEYKKFINNIPFLIRFWWWLRSQGKYAGSVDIVENGYVSYDYVHMMCIGVRPALLV